MRTIAIIGGGFSGTATAVQLMRLSPEPLRILLINRCAGMARGIAYGTNSALHQLNVPAGNMSALADEPLDFLRYCQAQVPQTQPGDFVSRRTYGDYLDDLLATTQQARSSTCLERVREEVVALQPADGQVTLTLGSGRQLAADHVVLAFGHFAPLDPTPVQGLQLPYYQRDPWAANGLNLQDAQASILLVGSGLTAMDVALSLRQQGHRGRLYLVSRRGLQPQPHRGSGRSGYDCAALLGRLLQAPPSVALYVHQLRTQVRAAQEQGYDWRDVLGALRPHTAALWQRLPVTERRRFLRHVQPYWDVHRHRVAPRAYDAFQGLLEQGVIVALAARIQQLNVIGDQIEVQLKPRFEQQLRGVKVAQVINCTGPNSDLRRVHDPLISQLCQSGWLDLDRLGTGLHVDAHMAVRDQHGQPLDWLSYVGPMLKADFWEATAVPELRQHAFNLAGRLISQP